MGVRVLVVDDQPRFRAVARDLLARRGYVVVGEAGTGVAALDAVERLGPDAVLLDTRLRDENGFDLSAALTRTFPELAVLLVSSSDYRDCDDSIRRCGARGFVLKSRLAAIDFSQFWPPCDYGAR